MNKLNTFFKIGRGLFKEFLIIFLYFFSILILSLIFYNNKNEINYTLSNILIYLIVMILFLFIFRKEIIYKWEDFKKEGKGYLKKTFIYYLIGLLIMIISFNIINRFFKMPLNEINNRNELLNFPFSSLLNILIFAPVIEELMTRVILKKEIKNKYLYILLSGLIFAFLHILNSLVNGISYEVLYLIPYGAIGIALSLIYYKTDNIWTSITFHSLHNLLCFLLILGGIA